MRTHEKVKSPSRAELAELISAVGGESTFTEILKDFYHRMAKDLLIGFFFTGHDIDHIATMQAQFILAAAGLSPAFAGKGPSTAHTKLPPILSGHFDRRLVILEETLNTHALDDKSIALWLHFEESFRAVVVAKG